MKRAVIIILSLTFAAVCCSRKDPKNEALILYTESMHIHDEIMPLMDEMFTLRQALTNKIDSLNADSVSNNASIVELRRAISTLEIADKGIMDWMHHIQDVPGVTPEDHHHGEPQKETPEVTSDEILTIQRRQKDEIESVRKDMEESLVLGRQLLSKE